ncbi:MAG: Gfo/Idh/MocA family oxidoreductase [Pedosphaera sp.]|nr:Gfo/Idh/MocA family oxidoreductase [Pedosphaera sp.]
MKRRTFLRNSTLMGAAFAGAPFIRAADIARKYRTALIGSGWWGKNILKEAMASGRCQVVALSDVDANALEVAGEQVNDLSGNTPKPYRDYRELLAKEKPEIVIIATPDHWHALNTIDSLKAGAHVFVEKPTGHTVNESRAMLKAARESERVVQVGLHRRIGPHHVSGMKFLKSGAVGDVGMVRLFAHGGGGGEQPAPNEEPPANLDWDFWCGPAPKRPFTKRLHPGGWRNFLDYANGTLGDWGAHWLDQVLWWNDGQQPKRIFCAGGRPIRGVPLLNERVQTTDTPDHQVATYEFERFTCVWEHRQFGENENEKHKIGAYYYGTKGVLHIGWRDGWTFYPTGKGDKILHEKSQLQEPDGHNIRLLWADFLDAIEQRRAPVASIEQAHRSNVLPLLGMISWRLGRSIQWDAAKEQIVGDPEALQLQARPYRAPWIYPAI